MLGADGGPPTGSLLLNQPIVLEAELEVSATIEEAVLEVGIAAVEGQRIVTAFNTDGGRAPGSARSRDPRAARGARTRPPPRRVRHRPRGARGHYRRSRRPRRTRAAVRRRGLRRRRRDLRRHRAGLRAHGDALGAGSRRRLSRRGRPHEAGEATAGGARASSSPVRATTTPGISRESCASWAGGPTSSTGTPHPRRRASITGRTTSSRTTQRTVAVGSRAISGSICGRSRVTTSSTSPTRTDCGSAIRCMVGSPSTSVRMPRSSCCGDWARRSSTPTTGASTACRRPRSRRGATGRCAWTAPWRERPDICSDERNLEWGRNRNRLAHFQCNTGDNRKDYNDDPTVHEVPQFFCLDPDFWRPDLDVPERWRLDLPASTVRIYHARRQLPATHRGRSQHQVQPHLPAAHRADEARRATTSS